jgi:hypothetical protein
VSPSRKKAVCRKISCFNVTQNITLLTSAIEISLSNHREKTKHYEVLVFLSFLQENAGIVPGNGLPKFSP